MHKESKRAEISATIAALPSMSKTDLVTQWERTFSGPPPTKLRRELMIPLLAYRIQETAFGGLSHAARAKLRSLVLQRSTTAVKGPVQTSLLELSSTSKLILSWRGEVHEVLVTEDGYVYRGEIFQKLSPIAKRITGTQWSGPAFFGTKQKGKAQ